MNEPTGQLTRFYNETGFELITMRESAAPPANTRTIILKATFELFEDAVWIPAKEQVAFKADTPHMDEIGRSLDWPSDFVAYKPHLDVLVHGAFHQPGGRAAASGVGGFAFGAMHKELAFFGPRRAVIDPYNPALWLMSHPQAMVTVPLRWEFAYGGLDFPANPLGCGMTPDDPKVAIVLPQIEHPGHLLGSAADRPVPANFAAVPPGFHQRQRKWGTRDRRWAWFRAPLPPVDYDPSVHNAAPSDQQADGFARGDEVLVLKNLHPRISELTTRLPGLRVRAGVGREIPGKGFFVQEVVMVLDTVMVRPDEDTLVLVWRGVDELEAGEGDPPMLRAEMERLEAEPVPFRQGVGARMLADYRAQLPPPPRPEPPPAPPPPPPAPPPDITEDMAKARAQLAKLNLPPAVQHVVDHEKDPEIVFQVVAKHIEEAALALQRKYSS